MFGRRMLIILTALLATACASRGVVLDLQGSIIYESPQISSISHSVLDGRGNGGPVVVRVELAGDPGITASFDITPGVADDAPMNEREAGRYSGEFVFPEGMTGGPFTIVGRLRHEKAGEVTMRDPDPITISLVN